MFLGHKILLTRETQPIGFELELGNFLLQFLLFCYTLVLQLGF